MAPPRLGDYFTCLVCQQQFYRSRAQIKRGMTKTCSKACLGVYFSGENNPFWGKTHGIETRWRVSQSRRGKAMGNQNAKGHHPTPERRAKQSERSKRLWQEHRQKMLDSMPRGEAHHLHKHPIEYRHRIEFTPAQRREWKEAQCRWCKSTENLTLDHIIPVFMGGGRYRENAQTLCQTCNTWKLWHVDVPQWHALQAAQGATVNPL